MHKHPQLEDRYDQDPQADRARELGIDLSIIDENLRLTPLERMRQHDHCVRQIQAAQARLGVTPPDDI